VGAATGKIPPSVDYEIECGNETATLTGYTDGDPTIEAWNYWKSTGQFPWTDSYQTAVASEVESLVYLDRCYKSWTGILDASAKE
jgi:hypothetical protein